jgi:hypothetical protein
LRGLHDGGGELRASRLERGRLRRQIVRGGALLLGVAQRCGDVEGQAQGRGLGGKAGELLEQVGRQRVDCVSGQQPHLPVSAVSDQESNNGAVPALRCSTESRPAVSQSPVGLDVRVREQEPHHLDVPVLRRQDERRAAQRGGLVYLDALAREQEPHHLDVTALRRDHKRRGPLLCGLLDLDALARKQEPHHLEVPVLRRHDERRVAQRGGLVDLDALAREQVPHHLDVTVLRHEHKCRYPPPRSGGTILFSRGSPDLQPRPRREGDGFEAPPMSAATQS